MSRTNTRRATLAFLFAVAAFMIWLGRSGWSVNFMPADWVGYILIAFGCAGLCGVNVWSGGPLDKRNDPPEETNSPALAQDEIPISRSRG